MERRSFSILAPSAPATSSRRHRVGLAALGIATYLLVLGPAFAVLGEDAGPLTFLPVALLGGLFGRRAGIVAAPIFAAVTASLLHVQVGLPWAEVAPVVAVGGTALAILGATVGHLSALRQRVRQELDQRRRAEDEADLLRCAVENARDAVVVVETAPNPAPPRIVYANRAFEKVTGYHRASTGALAGDLLSGVLIAASDLVHLRACFEQAQPFIWEAVNYGNGGIPFFASWDFAPIGPAPTRWVATLRDVTEEKRAEKALRENEARYRRLFHQSPEAVLVHSAECILDANAAAARVLGVADRTDLIGHSILDFLHPDQRDALKDLARALFEGREIAPSAEQELTRADGTVAVVEASLARVEYEGMPAIQAVLRDVTKRHLAERALRESEALLQASQRIARLGTWTWEASTQRLRWSENLYELAQRPRSYAPSLDDFAAAVHPEDHKRVLAELQDFLDHENLIATEARLVRPDGTEWAAFIEGYLERDASGKPLRAMGIIQDVTEQRWAEEALRASEARYRSVVESIREIVFQTDAEGHWTFLNSAWEEVTGFAVEHSLGQPCVDYLHPEDRARSEELFRPLLAREQEMDRHEIRYRTADGHYRWMEVTACLVLDAEGALVGTTGTLYDIAERRQTLEALEAALERERELGDLKTRFVAMASHELRTPLATIQASAELVDRFGARWEPEQLKKHLSRICRNVASMTDLLEEVLLLGRADAGRLAYQPCPVDLQPFLRHLLEETEVGIGARHRFHLTAEPVTAATDPKLLRIAVSNLLSNAVKYAPEESTIDVALRAEGGRAVIAVCDRGIGVPEKDLPRLFEPFHRATNVGTRRGSGLGLALVRRIVDLHDGTAEIASQEGTGTTVTLRLPLHGPAGGDGLAAPPGDTVPALLSSPATPPTLR